MPLDRQSASPQMVGGIHRDVTGRANEPLRFYLSIDRGLKSGKLEDVEIDEGQILGLIADGARALGLYREARRAA